MTFNSLWLVLGITCALILSGDGRTLHGQAADPVAAVKTTAPSAALKVSRQKSI
jgi:hypothetical protein